MNVSPATAPVTFQNISDLHYKDSVRVATVTTFTIGGGETHWTYAETSSGIGIGATLTYNTNAASSDSAHTTFFDGVTLVLNDRILVRTADATKEHNGIYTCTSTGSGSSKVVLTRAIDYDNSSECIAGTTNFVVVTNGTTLANTSYHIGIGKEAATTTFGTNTFTVVSPQNPASKVTVTDNESTSENNLITFVADAGDATGAHGLEMDGNLHYNPNTGTVTATAFNGPASTLSATLAVNKGGTGQTTFTNGQLLIGNTTGNTLAKSTLTAGNGIKVANTAGNISIATNISTTSGKGIKIVTHGSGLQVIEGIDSSDSVKGIASFSNTNFGVSSGAVTIKSGGVDLTDEVTGALPVANGGTGATSASAALVALGPTATAPELNKLDASVPVKASGNGTDGAYGHSHGTGDGVLVLDYAAGGNSSIKWATFATVCFLKGTKITLPDKSQKNIEDLILGEEVLTYQIKGLSNLKKDKKIEIMNWSEKSMASKFNQSKIRNIWVNPTDRYLVINDKLRITNLHIIHVKRGEEYKFLPAEKSQIGDLLFTDKGDYEPIQTIKLVNEITEVYNIGLQKHRTYFADNYLVHHLCETCSGLSGRI